MSFSIRPELVEGPFLSLHRSAPEGRSFDKLSPNGGFCQEISA
jgi:hypothetical protein